VKLDFLMSWLAALKISAHKTLSLSRNMCKRNVKKHKMCTFSCISAPITDHYIKVFWQILTVQLGLAKLRIE
jgi:hypothetical protein